MTTTTARPDSVRILGKDVKIVYSSTDQGMEMLGLCHYDRHLINIIEGQPAIGERNTVFHEVMHMTEYGMGLEMTEKQITVLTNGLIAVFEDNPEFAKYVIGLK